MVSVLWVSVCLSPAVTSGCDLIPVWDCRELEGSCAICIMTSSWVCCSWNCQRKDFFKGRMSSLHSSVSPGHAVTGKSGLISGRSSLINMSYLFVISHLRFRPKLTSCLLSFSLATSPHLDPVKSHLGFFNVELLRFIFEQGLFRSTYHLQPCGSVDSVRCFNTSST